MSVKALEWVSKIKVGRATHKAVLVALANFHHQKDGECRASLDTITQFTELNRKTVMPILDWLQEAGLISFDKGSRRHRKYTLHLDVQSPKHGTIRNADKSPNLGTMGGNSIVPKEKSYSPKDGLPKSQGLDHTREHGLYTGPPYSPPKGDSAQVITDRVIDYLNQKTGKQFRHVDANRALIAARLKEGFTEADCRQVIDNRVQRWAGGEMAQYLRPQTLFRPSKFESYLNDQGETGEGGESAGYDANQTDRLISEIYGEQEGIPWKH